MFILSPQDQQKLLLQLESECHNIITHHDKKNKALSLLKEIKLMAKPHYFEEEKLEALETISTNLHNYVNTSHIEAA